MGRLAIGKAFAALLAAALLSGAGCHSPSAADPGPFARTATLGPGAALPSDADCASRVVPSGPELRPANEGFNQTRGRQKGLSGPFMSRLTGDYTGTTDEIIQWAACKWGIDTDVVRAQAVKESTWFMTSVGDFTARPDLCAPGHIPGGDGRPGCPESVGIMSVKYHYHEIAFPEAGISTAYNLDYALAVWRSCFEGQEPWLADREHGSPYRAGDLWGCVGRWYTGDWKSATAAGYIGAVKAYMEQRSWTAAWFLALRAPTPSE